MHRSTDCQTHLPLNDSSHDNNVCLHRNHCRAVPPDTHYAAPALARYGLDVVISAVAARGDMEDTLRAALAALADDAAAAGVRLGVVGGAGSLFSTEGGPKLVDSPDFPESTRNEALVMSTVLDDLLGSELALDWFFVSPPPLFGDFAPGETFGRYRVGGDVALTTNGAAGAISGADFALAFADEIEQPARRCTLHRRSLRFLGGVQTISPIDTCHILMVSEPERLAELLVERCRRYR